MGKFGEVLRIGLTAQFVGGSVPDHPRLVVQLKARIPYLRCSEAIERALRQPLVPSFSRNQGNRHMGLFQQPARACAMRQ